ncbi:MAG: DNA-3-methyladenine glycosylase I [Myxococcaceae bacterium]
MAPDALRRCPWPGDDPLYLAYHDVEWGVPEWDERALFEKLLLDGFQAGLSWITILRKRDNYRKAFEGFHPERIARWPQKRVEVLMANPGIVRNRAKLEGSIRNARCYLQLRERQGSFARFLWGFLGGEPKVNHRRSIREVPAETKQSRAMSQQLRAAGFTFVGPTICYAFMQATGMVDDHLVHCFRHSDRLGGY